ncbi:MAG: universal stress protein [Candidatus Deferrimicrobium sp.]
MNILLPVSRGGLFGLALDLAIDTAKAHEGRIHVLFVVDAAEIERIESGARPGAIHLARRAADEARKRMADEGTAEIAEAERRIESAGIPVRGEIREGEVGRELIAAAGANDLLVSAAASHFAPDREDASGKLVLSVMREGGIPVLLSGSAPRSTRTIVAGCGGGIRTERAVGAMARLSLWKEAPRGILLAVDDAPEGGQERIAAPRRILADAGYPAWEEKILPGPRAPTFLAFCDSVDADVVVLGGWGEHRWDDLLGLSITGRLIEDGRRHLFLYM